MIEFASLSRSIPIAIGIDIAIKSSALIVIAILGRWLVARTPVVRSAVWNALLVGLILLPFATAAVPQWRIACLPATVESPVEMTPVSMAPATSTVRSSELTPTIPRSPSAELEQEFPRGIPEVAKQLSGPSTDSAPFSASTSLVELKASDMIVKLYLLVVVILLFRLSLSLAAVCRLVRGSVPVGEPRWVSALETCRKRLAIGSEVSLLSSRGVSIPVAVGWIFPAVILPETMVNDGESRLAEPVLLHELSHVRRFDYAWNLVARLIQIVYWPNPLFRLVAPLIRDDRERACDDVCIHLLGDRHVYQAALLEVASSRVRRPAPAPSPALGMAMARPSKLAGRLAWIAHSRGAARCLPRRSVRFAISASLVGVASLLASIHLTRAEPPKSEPPTAKTVEKKGRIFTLRVVDATTGKPVKAMVDLTRAGGHSLQFTDDQGRLEIRHSTGALDKGFTADVSADGLALQRHFWQEKASTPIPDEATVRLLPGEKLGGIVRDEQGKPISGVTVLLWSHNYKSRDPHELFYDLRSTTGPDGRWETRSAPEITGEIGGIFVKHPDFLSDSNHRTTNLPSIADLREGKAVLVMTKGTIVSGRVVDNKGRPVANADVYGMWNMQLPYGHLITLQAISDADGRFRLPQVKPGPLYLIAKAKGHGPACATMEVGSDSAAKVLRLGKSATFRGRFFDTAGKPLEGVVVVPDTWRGYRFLNVFLETDAEGRFQWNDGPDEQVSFNFMKEGYKSAFWEPLEPSDHEITSVLGRELQIRGVLRDKETKKRINDAQITTEIGEIEPGQNEPKWKAIDPIETPFYNIQVDAEKPCEFQFRILAKGYEPIVSRKFRHDEGSVTYDLELTKINAEKKGRIFTLKVVDATTGKPVKAMVVTSVAFEHKLQYTDDQGRLEIRHSTGGLDDSINVDVSADGLALQRHFWRDKPDAPMPDEATVKLLPGEKIGGIVRDEQGKPISGATVLVWSHNYKPRDPHELMFDVRATTGPDGRWETRSAPEITGEIRGICLKHPDFLSDTNYYTTKVPTIADLREGKAVSVMKKGTLVSGRVVDSKGRPVAGARVYAAENKDVVLDDERSLTATSDADGRFRLSQAKAGPLFLIAKAKGHGPGMETIQVEGESVAKVIRLGKPATFQGRVFDTSGNPLPGVLVNADRWRGGRLLNVLLATDAEGRFRWDDGPDEEIQFNFSREGFKTVIWRSLKPSDQDMPFVLYRELHIQGALRDKETKMRIRDAHIKIEVGRIEPGQEKSNWEEVEPIETPFYNIQMDAEKPCEFQFRILVKGYEPTLTRRFRHDEGSVTYDLELTKISAEKQKDLNGVVVDPEGKPLAGAQVFLDVLEQGSNSFEIRDGKFANPDLEGVLTTDAEGRFKIPYDQLPADGAGNLIVAHERFFGEMTVKALWKAGSTLKVRRWGRIEGKLKIGNKPAPNATVRQFSNIDRATTSKDSSVISTTKTDSEGNFKFDQVVPGEVLVQEFPADQNAPMKPMPRRWIDVNEGEVAMVQLGGTGRPVVATMFVPPDFNAKRDAATYVIRSKFEKLPVPDEVLEKGRLALQRWLRDWRATPEGKAHQRRRVDLDGTGLGEDGRIRVEDVGPGEYVFDISLNDQSGKRLRYSMPFVMPPIPGDWSDEPLDLGVIKPIVELPLLKPGDVALPFEAKGLDGKPITLDQFRGKTVLLTSWTRWLEPFKIGDLPQLRAVFEKHGKNPNFVMLSLNSDSDPKLADQFREKNPFPGIHGWIQGDHGSKFGNDYLRDNNIPAIFLIGSDGKFIAVRLRGRGIAEAVDQALGKK